MKRLLLALMMTVPGLADAQGFMYVQSVKAKILAAPAFEAPLIAEVLKGEKLTVVELQPRWVKVEFNGKNGWVSRLLLGEREPIAKITVFEGQEQSMEGNVRRRASAVTTAGAARGLAAEDRQRASQAGLANYLALERVETMVVNDTEALSFLEEGLKQ